MTGIDGNSHAYPDPLQDLVLPPAAPAQRLPPGYPLADPDYELREPDLAGEDAVQRDRRRARQRAHRGLARLLRLRPVSRRAMHAALVAEDAHVASGRDPAAATHGEIVVGGRAKAAADRVLGRCQRRLHRLASRTDRLRAKRAKLLTRAEFTDASHVRHPDGGHRPVAEVRADTDGQRTEIERETTQGSRKHRRLPAWLARIPNVVFVLDFSLLTYFFGGVTDVDWASPASVSLAFALLLALLVTVPCYGFLSFTGHQLRRHKDHTGAIWPGDIVSAIGVAGALLLICVVGTLMFVRMRTEVGYALGPGSAQTAMLIALTIAVVSAAANVLVIAVHGLDGSDQTARLDALSAAARRPTAKAERLRRRAALIPHRLAVLRRRARRLTDRAIGRASRRLAAADQVITAARGVHLSNGAEAGPVLDPAAHPGAIGYRAPQTGPRPDVRAVRTALAHVEEGE